MPSTGSTTRARAIPSGQELTNTAIAVAISLPANQSVTIFDISTLSSTPPMPATSRPASCSVQLAECGHHQPAADHQGKACHHDGLVAVAFADRAAGHRQGNAGREVKANGKSDVGDADAEIALY